MEINWIESILILILIILFVMILTRIFGNTATDIQVYLAFFSGLTAVAMYAINIHRDVSNYLIKLNREVGEIKAEMINSFKKVRNDINEIKEKIK